jgi:acetyltransferase-like isoleucine patch superfamily enzyme
VTATLGTGATVADDVRLSEGDGDPTVVGDDATIRSGSVVYADVVIGDRFTTGHGVLVREATTVGDDVLVGTHSVLDGGVDVGSRVSIQTNAYLPYGTRVDDDVFVGPGAVLTNDPYPVREASRIDPPELEAHVSVGANATVLPGVTVGTGSFVAAGAVVTEDVPPETLAVGAPAVHRDLPAALRGDNQL